MNLAEHYDSIADIIKMVREDKMPKVETLASLLVSYFSEQDPNFDQVDFLKKCGMFSKHE